jgi:hypothetical protein
MRSKKLIDYQLSIIYDIMTNTNTNTLKTHEPHHSALSEASSLLCSVGSNNTVLCAEDSYWDKKGGAPNILHYNDNVVNASTKNPRAFEDKLLEALKSLMNKY